MEKGNQDTYLEQNFVSKELQNQKINNLKTLPRSKDINLKSFQKTINSLNNELDQKHKIIKILQEQLLNLNLQLSKEQELKNQINKSQKQLQKEIQWQQSQKMNLLRVLFIMFNNYIKARIVYWIKHAIKKFVINKKQCEIIKRYLQIAINNRSRKIAQAFRKFYTFPIRVGNGRYACAINFQKYLCDYIYRFLDNFWKNFKNKFHQGRNLKNNTVISLVLNCYNYQNLFFKAKINQIKRQKKIKFNKKLIQFQKQNQELIQKLKHSKYNDEMLKKSQMEINILQCNLQKKIAVDSDIINKLMQNAKHKKVKFAVEKFHLNKRIIEIIKNILTRFFYSSKAGMIFKAFKKIQSLPFICLCRSHNKSQLLQQRLINVLQRTLSRTWRYFKQEYQEGKQFKITSIIIIVYNIYKLKKKYFERLHFILDKKKLMRSSRLIHELFYKLNQSIKHDTVSLIFEKINEVNIVSNATYINRSSLNQLKENNKEQIQTKEIKIIELLKQNQQLKKILQKQQQQKFKKEIQMKLKIRRSLLQNEILEEQRVQLSLTEKSNKTKKYIRQQYM